MRLTRRSSESRLVPDVVECIDCLWCRVRASTTVLFYKRGYEALGLAHCIPGNQDEVRGLIWTGVPSSEFYWARFRACKEAAIRSRVALLWQPDREVEVNAR